MKRVFFAIPLFCLALATTSCHLLDDDDSDLTQNLSGTVPEQVQDYIASNYNGLPIDDSGLEEVCDSLVFNVVELENVTAPDIYLYFDLNWNFLFEATDIPNAALPPAVLAAIQAQFPGYAIEPGNSERHDFPNGSVHYYVELESNTASDLDVVFQANGSVVCTGTDDDNDDDNDGNDDNDDNDNDDNDNDGQPSNIPASVLDFINDNYAAYQAQNAYNDDLCNDVPVFEVELEHGSAPDIDLIFDLSWNFLFEATDVQNAALPSAVLATVQSQFPGYSIEPGSSERYDFPDGTVQYYVELVSNSDDDLELVLISDGTIICTEED